MNYRASLRTIARDITISKHLESTWTPKPMTAATLYFPQPITMKLLRALVKASNPDEPQDIRDKDSHLIVRHERGGAITLYVNLGRGKRKAIANVRDIVNPSHPLTLEQAKARTREVLAQSTLGRDFAGERAKERAIPTLAQFLQLHYAPWLETERPRSGAQTLARLRRQFLPDFGRLKLDEITPERARRWKAAKIKKGIVTRRREGVVRRDISPRTIAKDLAVLKTCLNRAIEFGCIPENPIASVKVTDKAAKVVRALTEEEEARFRAALDAREEERRAARDRFNDHLEVRHKAPMVSLKGRYTDYLKPLSLVLLSCGLRTNEALSLRWRDIDTTNEIRVDPEFAKTGIERYVPMPREVLEALRRWRMQQPTTRANELVFKSPGGGKITALRKMVYRIYDAAGIDRVDAHGKRLTVHSLRHSYGTRLLQRGADLQSVADLMGHASVATTMRYLHSDRERRRAAVALLDADIEESAKA